MNYSPKNLIQLIEDKGYVLHPELRKTIVVPVHGNKDIPKGTFIAISKQAGISKDEL